MTDLPRDRRRVEVSGPLLEPEPPRRPPSPDPDRKPWLVPAVIVASIVAAGLAFGVARFVAFDDGTTSSPTTTSIEETTTTAPLLYLSALDVCRQRVRSLLKAPATAKFGPLTEANANQTTATNYHVIGYVDAENSFGALLRNDWTCDADYAGGGQWNVTATLIPR